MRSKLCSDLDPDAMTSSGERVSAYTIKPFFLRSFLSTPPRQQSQILLSERWSRTNSYPGNRSAYENIFNRYWQGLCTQRKKKSCYYNKSLRHRVNPRPRKLLSHCQFAASCYPISSKISPKTVCPLHSSTPFSTAFSQQFPRCTNTPSSQRHHRRQGPHRSS